MRKFSKFLCIILTFIMLLGGMVNTVLAVSSITELNANGISKIMYEPSSANGVTFNTSDVANDDMRIYIWENNLAPVTYPFVR